MNMIDNEDLGWAIENGISFFVFNFDRLENTIKIAKKSKVRARIHLELETGFNRSGFSEDEIDKVSGLINRNRDYLRIDGIAHIMPELRA
jgi:alanine racemase